LSSLARKMADTLHQRQAAQPIDAAIQRH
jgi:hypothetical protein